MSGSVSVVDINKLAEIVEPRWESVRVGRPPTGVNTQSFALTGARIQGIGLKPAVPNTVVISHFPSRMRWLRRSRFWRSAGT